MTSSGGSGERERERKRETKEREKKRMSFLVFQFFFVKKLKQPTSRPPNSQPSFPLSPFSLRPLPGRHPPPGSPRVHPRRARRCGGTGRGDQRDPPPRVVEHDPGSRQQVGARDALRVGREVESTGGGKGERSDFSEGGDGAEGEPGEGAAGGCNGEVRRRGGGRIGRI